MARVKHVKAAKDYPEYGIKKGDMHYYTKIKTGPYSSRVIRQKEPISPQQMTGSAYKAALYDLQDRLNAMSDIDEAKSIAEDLRTLGEEQQEKFDNMPEGLQQGETGQMIEERATACNEAADEIDQIADEWDEDTVRAEAESDINDEDQNGQDADKEAGEEPEPMPDDEKQEAINTKVQEAMDELLERIRNEVSFPDA